MITFPFRMAMSHWRRNSGVASAVTLVLLGAVWLPMLVDGSLLLGVLLAVGVVLGAIVGAAPTLEQQSHVLTGNGARRGQRFVIGAVMALLPGAVAFVIAGLGIMFVATGPTLFDAALITLIVPLIVGPYGTHVVTAQAQRATTSPGRLSSWLRLVGALAVIGVGLLVPPLGLALAAVWILGGSWSTNMRFRGIAVAVAFLAIVTATVLLGLSQTWSDLAVAATFLLPGLLIAISVVGMSVVAFAADRLGQHAPRLRLAVAPLMNRRRALASMSGLVVLVMTIAVSNAVVGASFGKREAQREVTLPTVTRPAGNAANQVIVTVPPVNAQRLRHVVASTLTSSGATGVVIEQVGLGASNTNEFVAALARTKPRDRLSIELEPRLPQRNGQSSVRTRSSWLGVVAPGDLELLHWGSANSALNNNEVVLVSGRKADQDAATGIVTAHGVVRLPAQVVDGPRGGIALPGALVSSSTAKTLSPVVTGARVVITPSSNTVSIGELLSAGRRVQQAASNLPTTAPTGLSEAERNHFNLAAVTALHAEDGVVAGSKQVVLWESGSLNEVAYFSHTATQARRAIPGLATLSVLLTLVTVLLGLGATRGDDAILVEQGAPARLRTRFAACQASLVSMTAGVCAAVLGIGIPLGAFALFNARTSLPPIPLVIPGVVWIVIVIVPAVTVLLAALFSSRRTFPRLTSSPPSAKFDALRPL